MIVIRKTQIEQFEKFSSTDGHQDLLAELTEFAPLYAKHVSPTQRELFVSKVVERSMRFGFTSRATISFFQELSILFGIGFGTDPQYVLVADALQDSTLTDEFEKAEILWEDFCDYLDFTAGEEFELHLAAVQRLDKFAQENRDKPILLRDESIVALLGELYPEKIDYIGEENAAVLVAYARQSCDFNFVDPGTGTAPVACAMLFLGYECLSDPLFPWISKVIGGQVAQSPSERAHRLQNRFASYIADYLTPTLKL